MGGHMGGAWSPLSSPGGAYLLFISAPYTGSGARAAAVEERLKDAGVHFDRGYINRVHFDRGYINRSVSWELKHIPRGEKRSLQNFLRFAYNALRRKHLTLGKTRHETLKELVEKIQKAHPDFIPLYDKDVFKI